MRAATIFAFLLLAAVAARFLANDAFLGDFRAFYCGAKVALQHADPYREQPLHRCELSTMPPRMTSAWRWITIPSPLPPYAIAFFAPFAMLSFAQAATIWVFLLLCGTAVTVIALLRLTSHSPVGVISALALSLFASSIMVGQPVPLWTAGLSLAALFAKQQRMALAAACVSLTLTSPQIGLAAFLSMFLWLPRSRVWLSVYLACIIALAVALLGAHAFVEYVTSVLPMHALSEVASDDQYSLTVILQAVGMPYRTAIALGSASYVVMAVVGIGLARVVASRYRDDALIVLVPPAVVLIGGPFMHFTLMAVAIPVGLVLMSKKDSPKNVAFAAILLLAIPWPMAQSFALAVLATAIAFLLAWRLRGLALSQSSIVAAAIAILALALHYMYGVRPIHGVSMGRPIAIDAAFAQASWAKLIFGSFSTGDAVSWVKRIPTWVGLVTLFLGATARSI